MSVPARPLSGKRVLVVEDEYFIADDMVREFENSGADVVGPVSTVEDALALLAGPGRLDGAVLDLNLRGATVFPVAEALAARRVPFLFATGYDRAMIPLKYQHVTRCEKPVAPGVIAKALFGAAIRA